MTPKRIWTYKGSDGIKELRDIENETEPVEVKPHLPVQNLEEFIYVPSINLYVAKERTLLGKNWFDTQKELHSKNEKMLNPYEFVEFLKYTKGNNKEIYDEITEVKSPWRAEWLDADFKVKNGILYINYHIFDEKGKIVQKSEVLDKNTLMVDKTPGVSLEDYLLNSHTSQGLPSSDIKKGDLYYWFPRSDNNSVGRFCAFGDWAYLDCSWVPSDRVGIFGVRAARKA